MQVILGDYVGAILGLVRDGLSWRLDPLGVRMRWYNTVVDFCGSEYWSQEIREASHGLTPRGTGNACSIEFNLLYRWHATLSKEDTQWTESVFKSVFNTDDYSSVCYSTFL